MVVELSVGILGLLGAGALGAPRALPAASPPTFRLAADERRSPPELVTSYTMRARLDADHHSIDGQAVIAWRNTAKVSVSSLFVHLYLNAFKNDRTLFLRSPFGHGRDSGSGQEFGYIDVKSLKVAELGDADLWPGRVRHSPNDPEDETDIELPLPRPVQPGERLTIDADFTSQLPQIVERTGYASNFHLVAQWFPKLARLESDGHFAHFAFHPQAEFYADFGRYDVTVDVPAAYRVGASGVQTSETTSNGRRTLRYLAEPVHDFAFAAWADCDDVHFRVDHVDVRLLLPKGHSETARRTEAALRFALPYFSERFGSYPYSTLTLVHPPAGAEAAGGMEYPTLITTGGAWYLPYSGARSLEALVIHEFGHQWFYGLLASNEAKSPFLDEGINSYAELAAMDAAYGRASAFRGFGLEIADASLFRAFAAARGHDEPVGAEAQDFSSFRNLGALVYSRTAVLIETVGRVWGQARLERALHIYAERFRFLHPTPEDFLGVVEREVAPEARRMLEVALFSRGTIDYVVRDLESAQQDSPAGFFERDRGRERVTRVPSQTAPYRGRVTVYRHGLLEIPVEVLLRGEDGSQRRERWNGQGALKSFEYEGHAPLASVVVDPDHKILIDDDLYNNQVSAHDRALPRVHERLSYFAALGLIGAAP